jgi:RNA polymerase sigma-70 factor (ECF subfamily)
VSVESNRWDRSVEGESDTVAESLLAPARDGDHEARGVLLTRYRDYLLHEARSLIGAVPRAIMEPSDLVQEAYLRAHRDFPRFLGSGEPELVAWLRQILVRSLADQVRHYRAQRRDYRRQESLERILEKPGGTQPRALAARVPRPSEHAMRREQATILAHSLARLPADYRQVIVLRNLEQYSIGEISTRMGRSANAVRKLWSRAMTALSDQLM